MVKAIPKPTQKLTVMQKDLRLIGVTSALSPLRSMKVWAAVRVGKVRIMGEFLEGEEGG
jgi:hypothetical protein